MNMNDKEWEIEAQRRAGLVAQYFKPKENQIIQDFIVTARDVSKEELAEKKEGKK